MIPLRIPGGWTVRLHKAWAVARLHGTLQLTYPGEVIASTAFAAVAMFTLTALWRALSVHHDLRAMTGFDLDRLIWYLAFSETLALSFAIPWEGLPLDREIRSGDVVYRLARPQGYPAFHFAAVLGERLMRMALRLPMHAAIAWLLVGWPGLSALAVAAALAAGVLAAAADLVWVLVCSFASFWVEDTFGLHFLYRRCVFLLGGLLVPLEAYPLWLRRVAEALPFKDVLYGPARLFVAPDAHGFLSLARAQLTMAAVGILTMALVYQRGVRRLAAQGG